jgi:hypothetical protein
MGTFWKTDVTVIVTPILKRGEKMCYVSTKYVLKYWRSAAKVCTNFADKGRSLGRYSLLAV